MVDFTIKRENYVNPNNNKYFYNDRMKKHTDKFFTKVYDFDQIIDFWLLMVLFLENFTKNKLNLLAMTFLYYLNMAKPIAKYFEMGRYKNKPDSLLNLSSFS